MPTILRSGPYRFFFYSGDGAEPPHVHVERDDATAKFWLMPVTYVRSSGFSGSELSTVQRLILEHREVLLSKWNEHFGH